jgi:hypothetical protein
MLVSCKRPFSTKDYDSDAPPKAVAPFRGLKENQIAVLRELLRQEVAFRSGGHTPKPNETEKIIAVGLTTVLNCYEPTCVVNETKRQRHPRGQWTEEQNKFIYDMGKGRDMPWSMIKETWDERFGLFKEKDIIAANLRGETNPASVTEAQLHERFKTLLKSAREAEKKVKEKAATEERKDEKVAIYRSSWIED